MKGYVTGPCLEETEKKTRPTFRRFSVALVVFAIQSMHVLQKVSPVGPFFRQYACGVCTCLKVNLLCGMDREKGPF